MQTGTPKWSNHKLWLKEPKNTKDAKACCSACGSSEPKIALQACSRCKVTMYCSRTCQKKSWPVHKQQCKKLCGSNKSNNTGHKDTKLLGFQACSPSIGEHKKLAIQQLESFKSFDSVETLKDHTIHGVPNSTDLSAKARDDAVQIHPHKTRGNIIVATFDIVRGTTISTEPPLLCVQEFCRSDPLPPTGFKIDPQIWKYYTAFLDEPVSVQQEILELYSPTDGKKASEIWWAVVNAAGLDFDKEVFIKVAMIFRFNSALTNPQPKDGGLQSSQNRKGHSLFKIASRLSHSCEPNCCWFSASNGDRIVRTIKPVKQGDELTVNYLNDDWLAKPVSMRRAKIDESWEFTCECGRCCAEIDETRRFRCATKSCAGHHFPIQTGFTLCSSCHNEAPTKHVQRMLQQEKEIASNVKYIESVLGSIDVTRKVVHLVPPHRHHYLALEISQLQFELYTQLGQTKKAVQALRAKLECWDTIVLFPTRPPAFMCESIGDVLAVSPKLQTTLEAARAYTRAVHTLHVTDGSSPYSKLAVSKLIHTHQKLTHDDVENSRLAHVLEDSSCPCNRARSGL